MVEPDRRPTAQEIEELIDLVQRDPASPAFIDLGEAYLALGRPRDAIGVGSVGLEAAPDSLEGRVMLARAHASLHQWKEAQAELLRVVKIDRSNRRGFALLGEVLLRRTDYERAIPVLQHAQNLDPANPAVLSLLKRARASQQLDPPPPLPQPVPPRGETDNYTSIQRSMKGKTPAPVRAMTRSAPMSAHPAPAPVKTRSAPMAAQPMAPPPAPPPPAPPPVVAKPPPPAPRPAPPAPMISSDLEVRGDPTMPEPRGDTWAEPTTSLLDDDPPAPPARIAKKSRPVAYPPAPSAAAAGENYLNDLLTVGGVSAESDAMAYDTRPDKRWGRSTRATFIFLFVVLVLGVGGGGGFYYWSEKKKAAAVRELQAQAKAALKLGDYAGIKTSIDKLGEALDTDKTNLVSLAYASEAAGLDALLYGVPPDAAEQAIAKASKDIDKDEPGYREIIVGKAAVELSKLGVVTQGRPAKEVALAANTTLAETAKMLDDYLDKHADDRWVRWLRARTQLAAGERKAARVSLKKAADGEDGLVVAMIDQANLLADDGNLEEAIALYDKVLAKAKQHPLAVLGKALARAEAGLDASTVIDDINLALGGDAKKMGPRVTRYRALAVGLAELGIEDYPRANADLRTAAGGKPLIDEHLCAQTTEPRYWAGVAWGAYMRGDPFGAASARNCVIWYGKDKAEDDPAVQIVDAGLALAEGHPDKALAIAEHLEGPRARAVRVYADLDLRKLKEAQSEADKLVEMTTPSGGDAKQASIEARILAAEAHMVNAATDKDREPLANELDKLASQAQSKLGRHALGMAWVIVGNAKEAQVALELANKDLSEANPNPLAYRTKTALAELLVAQAIADGTKQADDAKDKLARAHTLMDEALKLDSGYDPALVTMGKVLVREGDLDKALSILDSLLKQQDVPPPVQLLYAEILVSKKDATDADRDQATKILRDIKDKIQPPSEVGRVANLIDLKLPADLGVPVPPDAPGPLNAPAKPTTPPPHHHH